MATPPKGQGLLDRSLALTGLIVGPALGVMCGVLWDWSPLGIFVLASMGLVAGAGIGVVADIRGAWPLPLAGALVPPWYRMLYVWVLRGLWVYAILLPAGLERMTGATLRWTEAWRPALRAVVPIYDPLLATYRSQGLDPATAAVFTHGYAVGILVVAILLPLGWLAGLQHAWRHRATAPVPEDLPSRLGQILGSSLVLALALLGLWLGTFIASTDPAGGFIEFDARNLPLPFSLLNLHLVLAALVLMAPTLVQNLLPRPRAAMPPARGGAAP